jgi:hypothetical protein
MTVTSRKQTHLQSTSLFALSYILCTEYRATIYQQRRHGSGGVGSIGIQSPRPDTQISLVSSGLFVLLLHVKEKGERMCWEDDVVYSSTYSFMIALAISPVGR